MTETPTRIIVDNSDEFFNAIARANAGEFQILGMVAGKTNSQWILNILRPTPQQKELLP